MERPHRGEEREYNETEKRWNLRKTGAFIIALLVAAFDILALALGTIISAVPIALSIACVGVITFVGVLTLSNYLSRDPELARKEMRKAIAASFTLVYLALLALVVFNEDSIADTELAKTVVGHFTWVVGIIIIFYFGSRSVDEYLKRKDLKEGEKKGNGNAITGGGLIPVKPPLPNPIERKKVTGAELYQIIRDKFPEGDIHLSDPWSEAAYSLCDIEDIEAFLDVDETNHYQYVRHKFDCDNFSRLLWGQFGIPEWAHFAIGLFWSDVHAMVICVDANEDVWLIEPQTDERRSELSDWQRTKMRFTIM